jgi:hypothetical protein
MARRRESSRSRRARGRQSASRPDSTRRRIRLATFATVVGIVTSFVTIALGAFDLREKVGSVDARDRVPASASYVQELADVCGERDDAQETRRTDAYELKRRMKVSSEFPQQRLLIHEFLNRELARGDYVLAKFAGLVAPTEVGDDHRAVRRLWEGIGDRLRLHRDRIEASVTRAGLVEVLDGLKRSLVETQARDVDAGLRRLGGPACQIGPPQALPVVNLPTPDPSGQQRPRSTDDQPTSADPEAPSERGSPAAVDRPEPDPAQQLGEGAEAKPDVVAPRYESPPDPGSADESPPDPGSADESPPDPNSRLQRQLRQGDGELPADLVSPRYGGSRG